MPRSSLRTVLTRADAHRAARTLPELMANHERLLLIQAMQLNGWSRTRAAESLGITRSYFYKRARALHIHLDEIPRQRAARPPVTGGRDG